MVNIVFPSQLNCYGEVFKYLFYYQNQSNPTPTQLSSPQTVKVVDVFAMPQSGTGVSVEAVDPVFQSKMLDMLKQTGRPEMVVGWYHSHPGFGCWLSGVDINTQQSFEALSDRAVAVVVDPVQSVKGKVVIDAFRLINPNTMVLGQEPRQTTVRMGISWFYEHGTISTVKTVQRVYLSTLQYLITECLKLTLRDIFHIFYNIYSV